MVTHPQQCKDLQWIRLIKIGVLLHQRQCHGQRRWRAHSRLQTVNVKWMDTKALCQNSETDFLPPLVFNTFCSPIYNWTTIRNIAVEDVKTTHVYFHLCWEISAKIGERQTRKDGDTKAIYAPGFSFQRRKEINMKIWVWGIRREIGEKLC